MGDINLIADHFHRHATRVRVFEVAATRCEPRISFLIRILLSDRILSRAVLTNDRTT